MQTSSKLREYKEWVGKLWSPSIAIIASSEAESACIKAHQVSITQLLGQFGDLKGLKGGTGVPVRTAAERPLRIHNWTLRFFTGNEISQTQPQKAEQHLSDILTSAVGAQKEEVLDIDALQALDDSTPWYTAYKQEYVRLMAFGEHETMDNPVACLVILPANVEGDLASQFKALLGSVDYPWLQDHGVERTLQIHYVVVQDTPQQTAEIQTRISNASTMLGRPCHLITLGSGLTDGGSIPTSSPNFVQGASPDVFVHDLTVRSIIPDIESRIRALDQTVTAIRRGLRNQIKSLLFRKSDPGTAAPQTQGQGGDRVYKPSSVEHQLRELSDLSIMVGDYETALSTLRLLASDYKQDKAYKHYAAVQEAMAVAAILSDGSPIEAITNFKEAFYRYLYCDAVRYAIRSVMLFGGYLEAIGRPADASWIYMKAHNQENHLRAGLLLERAAHCFLESRPVRLRKFAFHLVLAGLRYNQGGQHVLARRTNAIALRVYDGRQWALPEEHVHESLGKLFREEGQKEVALNHFMSALACSHGSAAMQRLHYAQFTDTLKEAGEAPVMDLPLPEMKLSSRTLTSTGQTRFASAQARQVDADVWRQLEASLPLSSSSSWLEGGSRANLLNDDKRLSCCVGEDLGIDVQLSNPLGIELAITHLRLVCSFQPGTGGGDAPPAAGKPDTPMFHVREERITLRGEEQVTMQLRVKPLRPGTLQVEGIAWTLGGVAQGVKQFSQQPTPAAAPKVPVWDFSEMMPTSNVVFSVLPPMPRLEVSYEGFPSTAFAGQVIKCGLRLKNSGSMSLQSMAMTCFAGSMFLCSTTPGDPSIDVSVKQGVAMFTFPKSMKLGVNQELLLPVWFRVAEPGPAHINAVWYYEPLIKPEGLRLRTLRSSHSMTVLPSIQLYTTITASPSSTGCYLMQLHALNLQGLETFSLSELSVHSEGWALRSLTEDQSTGHDARALVTMDAVMAPEAAVSLRYLLTRVESGGTEATAGLEKAEKFLIASYSSTQGDERPTRNALPSPQSDDKAVEVLVRWQGAGDACSGLYPLNQLRIRDAHPVQFRLVDSGAQPGSSIRPVIFEIRNMFNLPLTVSVDTVDTGTGAGGTLPDPSMVLQPSKKYAWCGPSKIIVEGVIDPGQLVRVPLCIAVLQAGYVCIDDYSVSWKCATLPTINATAQGRPCHLTI